MCVYQGPRSRWEDGSARFREHVELSAQLISPLHQPPHPPNIQPTVRPHFFRPFCARPCVRCGRHQGWSTSLRGEPCARSSWVHPARPQLLTSRADDCAPGRRGPPSPCFQTTPLSAPAPLLLPSVCPSPPPPSVEAAAMMKLGLQHPLLPFLQARRGLSRWSLKSERSPLLLPSTSPRPLPSRPCKTRKLISPSACDMAGCITSWAPR